MAEEAQTDELAIKFDPKATLKKLREYRKRDPDYRAAVVGFVEGELTNADPVEGEVLKEEIRQPGPTQSKVREMLGA